MRSSSSEVAGRSRASGSWPTRFSASPNGWIRSRRWAMTRVGAVMARRSSAVGHTGPVRMPCRTALMTSGDEENRAMAVSRGSFPLAGSLPSWRITQPAGPAA